MATRESADPLGEQTARSCSPVPPPGHSQPSLWSMGSLRSGRRPGRAQHTGPMAGRPLLLVDIDGVLNVFGVDACPNGYAEHAVFPEDDQPMRSATIHGVWLRDPAGAFPRAGPPAGGFQPNQPLGPTLNLEESPCGPRPKT